METGSSEQATSPTPFLDRASSPGQAAGRSPRGFAFLGRLEDVDPLFLCRAGHFSFLFPTSEILEVILTEKCARLFETVNVHDLMRLNMLEPWLHTNMRK